MTDPVQVNPAWLRWARRTALMSRRRAAEELFIAPGTLQRWERDGIIASMAIIGISELKAMGKLYRRNYVLFWTPTRPPYGLCHWAPFRWWQRAFMRRLARWCRSIAKEWGDD